MHIEMNARGIASVFFRQIGILFGVFIIITALGIAYLIQAEPVYQARGSMLVRFGQDARPQINMPDNSRPEEISFNERSELIKSNIKILQSHNLLRGVIHEIGAENLYPELTEKLPPQNSPVEAAIRKVLGGDMKVLSDDSNVIEIFYENKNPELTVVFVDEVMKRFIKLQSEVFNTPQTTFLQQQTEEAKQRLEESQKEFQEFKEQAGISAIDEEMSQLIQEKSEISRIAFESVTEAQTRLAELEAQAAELRSTYRLDSPTMKKIQSSLRAARQELKERQNALQGGEGASKSSVSKKIASLNKRIAYLEAQRARYRELEQRVEIDESNYVYYKQRGEEARVNNLLNMQNITRFTIIDKPVLPRNPVKPGKTLIIFLSMLGGLVIGTGWALAAEIFDDRFTRPEHISSALGIPVFAAFNGTKR